MAHRIWNAGEGGVGSWLYPKHASSTVIGVPGAGYRNIGGMGEDNSPDPYDHVDDAGNAPPLGLAPSVIVGNAGNTPGVRPIARAPVIPNEVTVEEQSSGATPRHTGPSGGDGGWTPPKIGGWQPPTIGGGLDVTPGPRTGLPWTGPGGEVDLTPGPDVGVPKFPSFPDVTKPFDMGLDFAKMMPMMLLMMMMKNR